MRKIFLVPVLLLLLPCGCELFTRTHTVTLVMEERSPWEVATGGSVWYHLLWLDPVTGVHERYLSAGVESVDLNVSKGPGFVAAAYPAGSGTPLGGSSTDGEAILSYDLGAAADAVLHAEKYRPGCCSLICFRNLASMMYARTDGDPWCVNKPGLYSDLIQQNLSEFSIVPCRTYSIVFHDLPEGFWISDTPRRSGFFVHDSGTVAVAGFYTGTFRYLLAGEQLMLTVIGQEEEAYWYVSRVFPEYVTMP